MEQRASDEYNMGVDPKVWDSAADQYDEVIGKASSIASSAIIDKAHAMRSVNDPDAAALEFAAGTGSTTHLLANKFPRLSVLATDIAPGMLRILSAKDATGRIDTRVADMAAPSAAGLVDSMYTHIFVTMAVGVLEDPVDSAKEWSKLLKPGGVLAIATWDWSRPFGLYDVWKKTLNRCDPSFVPEPLLIPGRWLDEGSISEGMVEAGFVDVEADDIPLSLDFSPFPGAYMEWWWKGTNPFAVHQRSQYPGDLSLAEIAMSHILEQEYKHTGEIPVHAALVVGRTRMSEQAES